jgi:hypothetical protein
MVSFHLTSAILFGEILYAKVQRAVNCQEPQMLTFCEFYSSLPQIADWGIP